ncbi:hypothetical protein G9A89_018194 [Geosiphon pyriformis]|nr:hypothetical protein G9A89_018194 [Geosiphon pyriformis]
MSCRTSHSSLFFSKASLTTEPIAKIGDWVVVLFKTEKLAPRSTLKVLHAKEILSESILERTLRAVLIKAIGRVFIKTPSHS